MEYRIHFGDGRTTEIEAGTDGDALSKALATIPIDERLELMRGWRAGWHEYKGRHYIDIYKICDGEIIDTVRRISRVAKI